VGGEVEWVRIKKEIWPKNEEDGPSGKKGEPEIPVDLYQNCILVPNKGENGDGSKIEITI